MSRVLRIVFYVAVSLAAVAALALSILAFYGVMRLQQIDRVIVGQIRSSLPAVADYTIETTLPLSQTFPISTSFPLHQDFVVPIRTTLPISTVVHVPIDLPLVGRREVSLPVQAEIPVNLRVVIPVSQTVPVQTTVALDADFPLRLELRQLGLASALEQVDMALQQIEENLDWP